MPKRAPTRVRDIEVVAREIMESVSGMLIPSTPLAKKMEAVLAMIAFVHSVQRKDIARELTGLAKRATEYAARWTTKPRPPEKEINPKHPPEAEED